MPVNTTLKSRDMDDFDRKILMELQKDGRMPLKDVAKSVGLSIDSVHKRIKELKRKEILFITTAIDPVRLGFNYITDNKIRLKASSEEEKQKFIRDLVNHPQVLDLIEILGAHDFTCSIVATDNDDLVKTTSEIKQKFRNIIDEWDSFLVLKHHKFDTYTI